MFLLSIFSYLLFCFVSRLTLVESHSWVECTDYDMSIDIEADDFDNSFDESSCSGFKRNRKYYTWHTYAKNSGIDWLLFVDGNRTCKDTLGSSDDGYSDSYSSSYPMANYEVGETKRLIWPAKNHAGYECKDDQKDNQMQLWVNKITNPSIDLGNGKENGLESDGWTLVIDWHIESGETFVQACTDGDCDVQSYVGHDGVPFQNCPHFCDDTDAAVCYGDFVVPNIFPEDGYYTFLWYWEFKSNEIYTDCFEVYISGTDSTTDSNTDSGTNTDTDTDTDTDSNSNSNSDLNKGSGNDNDATVSTIIWILCVFGLLILIGIITFLMIKKKKCICNKQKEAVVNETDLASTITINNNKNNIVRVISSQDIPRPQNTGTGTQVARGEGTGGRYGPRPTRPPPPPPAR